MFVIGTLKPNDIFELLPGMLFCDRVMRSHVPYSFGSLFYFKDSSLLFRFYVSVTSYGAVWSLEQFTAPTRDLSILLTA